MVSLTGVQRLGKGIYLGTYEGEIHHPNDLHIPPPCKMRCFLSVIIINYHWRWMRPGWG